MNQLSDTTIDYGSKNQKAAACGFLAGLRTDVAEELMKLLLQLDAMCEACAFRKRVVARIIERQTQPPSPQLGR